MKNVLGDNLTLTLFGESHGQAIGITIDGLSAGMEVDEKYISELLTKRRPQSNNETKRIEKDEYKIISGVFNGYTTGAPLTIIIPNNSVKSADYESISHLARPSHADYVSEVKYHGFQDYRGGGHFSGRITASIVAGGAIILKALEKKGIKIATHILRCGNVYDNQFTPTLEEIDDVNKKNFPTILDLEQAMNDEIAAVRMKGDSIGGITQTVITGLDAGLGNPWFSSIEGKLSLGLFGIGGIKGIEFGEGFNFANLTGSQANDAMQMVNDEVAFKNNHNGGINGGISNGAPIIFNCAVKPTPSISLPQDTIDYKTMENVKLEIVGRHDPAIIRRICIVITALTAFIIADLLVTKYGEDYLK